MVCFGAGRQDLQELGPDLCICQIRSPFFGHDNNIPGRQHLLVASKKLPEQALYAVALKGLAHLASGHQPQTASWPLPRGQGNAEMRRIPALPPGLGPEVLLTAAEPLVSGKAGRLRGGGGSTGEMSWAGGLGGVLQRCSLYLHRQALAAFGSAVFQYPASPLGAHAAQKAMSAGPFQSTGLIGLFHDKVSFGQNLATNIL
jgi:hypothetical protein